MADKMVSDFFGRQNDFLMQSMPSLSFEKLNLTSQLRDFDKLSISFMVSASSRTISFPSGLKILSTSAITPLRLHLKVMATRNDVTKMIQNQENTIGLDNYGPKTKPVFNGREEMVCVKEIVRSWISAERFAPVVVYSDQSTLIDYWQRVWRFNWHYIHDPDFQVFQSSSKTVSHKKRLSKYDQILIEKKNIVQIVSKLLCEYVILTPQTI